LHCNDKELLNYWKKYKKIFLNKNNKKKKLIFEKTKFFFYDFTEMNTFLFLIGKK